MLRENKRNDPIANIYVYIYYLDKHYRLQGNRILNILRKYVRQKDNLSFREDDSTISREFYTIAFPQTAKEYLWEMEVTSKKVEIFFLH